MAVVLVLRIDDRLVHGQVVEGWLKALRINHIVVASDQVDADDTQKALYFWRSPRALSSPVFPWSMRRMPGKQCRWKKESVLVLVSTPEDARRLLISGRADPLGEFRRPALPRGARAGAQRHQPRRPGRQGA